MRATYFYETIIRVFKRVVSLDLNQFLWKTKTFLRKTLWLNRIVCTKWTYTHIERERERERSFTTNYFNSFSKLIWEEEPLINNWYNVPASQMSIFTIFVSDWVLNWGAFFLWVFLSYVWIGTLWDQSITAFTSEHFFQKQEISCHWLNLAWPGVFIALRTQSACSAVPTKNIYHLTDR